jgi:hypothetical protein
MAVLFARVADWCYVRCHADTKQIYHHTKSKYYSALMQKPPTREAKASWRITLSAHCDVWMSSTGCCWLACCRLQAARCCHCLRPQIQRFDLQHCVYVYRVYATPFFAWCSAVAAVHTAQEAVLTCLGGGSLFIWPVLSLPCFVMEESVHLAVKD